jgi:hypothetical protein
MEVSVAESLPDDAECMSQKLNPGNPDYNDHLEGPSPRMRRKTMKRLMLRAVAMVLTFGIGSAYAADGQSPTTLFTSVEAQQRQHSIAVGALQTSPLFTSGGAGVRMWAPVAPPYNAGANGNLAARNIWGAG